MTEEAFIRSAGTTDANAIGRVHVACLHEAYEGLLPPGWLAAQRVEDRASRWRNILDAPAVHDVIAVHVAECHGEVCGLASCGLQRTEFLKQSGFAGEFRAIYVLRRFQRRGIGWALMRRLTTALLQNGIKAAGLWCLSDNTSARRFYEHVDGEFLLEQPGTETYAHRAEVAYGWRNLARARKLNAGL